MRKFFVSVSVSSILLTAISVNAAEIEINDYRDIEAYFESKNYTPESWKQGNREVPNFTFSGVGDRWRNRTVKEVDVKTKKRLFFRALAPLGLLANQEVQAERDALQKIIDTGDLTESNQTTLNEKLVKYRVVKEPVDEISDDHLVELFKRVDIVPLSLILSQAAEESGWGTSRFAAEGNALFGQWTWGPNAMIPKQQRKELGNYGLEKFDTPLDAVRSYIMNLNRGTAYADLRDIRYTMRDKGEPIRGKPMANGLTKYSERGEEYVKGIKAIMRVNKLAEADFAVLAAGEQDHLVRKIKE